MKRVNELVICKDNYNDEVGFENAIKEAIMLLLEAEYILTIRYDDKHFGIVVIEYEAHPHLGYGNACPYWLYPEEEETVVYKED